MNLNFITKKRIFIIFIVCLISFGLLIFLYNKNIICGVWWECYDLMLVIAYAFLVLAFLLLPAFITFFLGNLAFTRWKMFALFSIPVFFALLSSVFFKELTRGFISWAELIVYHTVVIIYPVYLIISFIV